MISYKQAMQRGFGIARRGARQIVRLGRYGAGVGTGAARRVTNPVPRAKELDDVTLARKVETEIFREADAPRAKVSVNAVDGVVELRGEVKTPELIRDLERRTRKIVEVRDVENLLHLPKTPARRQRKRSAGGSTPRREPRRVNADKSSAKAETPPKEAAARGEGRRAAPLGSRGDRES